jgi:quercetin dioxygenase-like cupin family protein
MRAPTVAVALGLMAGALAGSQTAKRPAIQVLRSAVFDWNGMRAEPTDVGHVRHVFRAPTTTLDQLECHITTLDAGAKSHPPHTHPNDEVLIVREGNVEVFFAGAWHPAGPGSVVFLTGMDPHGLRNAGSTATTYTVLAWHAAAGRHPASQKTWSDPARQRPETVG